MDISKKNIILKTWDRCKSIPGSRGKSLITSKSNNNFQLQCKKEDDKKKGKSKVAPSGCFWVYVGPERQRFVIKMKYANHPLFQMLLEDAETEYGYSCNGPILLPCDVDLFYKVLAEMDNKEINDDEEDERARYSRSKSYGFGYGSCSPFNQSRRPSKGDMAKGLGSYGLLTPSPLIKMN